MACFSRHSSLFDIGCHQPGMDYATSLPSSPLLGSVYFLLSLGLEEEVAATGYDVITMTLKPSGHMRRTPLVYCC